MKTRKKKVNALRVSLPQVRVTPEQLAAFKAAAASNGVTLTGWARSVLNEAVMLKPKRKKGAV